MSRRVQLIRHTTGAANTFVGLQGEITVDTTKKEFRLHDGLAAGGIPQARADLDNVEGASTSVDGKLVAADKQKLDWLGLTQAADLDAIEINAAASKVITDFITLTQAIDLDTLESDVAAAAAELAYIAVTQAVDLDTMESTAAASKVITDWIAVTQAVNLDTMESNIANNVSKLSGIESGADVTDATNVTSAGALMDAEVDADLKTLSLPANVTISTFIKTLLDDAAASNARTTLGVDPAGTVNYTHPDHSGHASSVADGAITLLVAAITGQPALTSGLADADEILVSDNGVLKRMDASVMNAYFNSALVFKTPTKDHGVRGGNYTLQLDEAELHLIDFSATAILTIASSLTNDKATVVIKNSNFAITLAGIDNDSPTLTQAASVQDFVGLIKSFGKISAVAVKLNRATT